MAGLVQHCEEEERAARVKLSSGEKRREPLVNLVIKGKGIDR